MPDQSPNEFVLASSVRTEIVTHLAERAASIDELLTSVDASDSAVYDAVSTLADRGILSEDTDGWELSAHGQIVADAIDQWQSTEAFLGADPAYWKNHDASVIPRRFRRRLSEIGEYEVVRSVESQVTRHHRAALTRLREADHCLIVSPFFSVEYHNAIPDSPKTRVLANRTALDTREQRRRDGLDAGQELHHAELRATQSKCSYAVGDDFLVLGLPTQSGAPTKAHVVSETEAAVQWGTDLFEATWEASESV
jgi:predicted transcriptional regulator